MKKKIIILLILFITGNLYAQEEFSKHFNDGKIFYKKGEYENAFKSFRLANSFTKKDTKKTKKVFKWIVLCNEAIIKKNIELKNALKKANKNYSKTDSLLKIVIAEKKRNQKLSNGALLLLTLTLPANEKSIYKYYRKLADSMYINSNYYRATGYYKGVLYLPEAIDDEKELIENIKNSEWCYEAKKQADIMFYNKNVDKANKLFDKILIRNTLCVYSKKIKKQIQDIKNGVLVYVKGGSFIMGNLQGNKDEKPLHDVLLSNYYIGKTEVTNEQFSKFMNEYGSQYTKTGIYKGKSLVEKHRWGLTVKDGKWIANQGFEKHPVVSVSWYGAYEYCKFYNYKLPSEAQWMFAATGGSKSQERKYSGNNNIDKIAWYAENSTSTSKKGSTQAVATKKPNEIGIFDMTGNVWEWCLDDYKNDYFSKSPIKNPVNKLSGVLKVYKGGSWNDDEYYCRLGIRGRDIVSTSSYLIGFRVVSSKN